MGRDQTVINHSLCEKNIKTGLIEGVKSIRKQKVFLLLDLVAEVHSKHFQSSRFLKLKALPLI